MQKNLRRYFGFIAAICLILPAGSGAFHVSAPAPSDNSVGQSSFAVQGSVGYTALETTELVFNTDVGPGVLLSELDWEAGVVMIGLSGSWRMDRWVAGLGIWQSVATVDGEMIDFDWLIDGVSDWSDRSISDAEVDVTIVDVNAGATVLAGPVTVDLLLGFRYDMMSWEASGGSFIYSEFGFRDSIGDFGPGVGITYEVDTWFPYIGVHGYCTAGPVDLKCIFMYSPLVTVEAVDFHIDTDTHFEDSFDGSSYIGAGIEGSMAVSDNVRAAISIFYENVPEEAGDNLVVEDDLYTEDGAGYANESISFTASVICLL